MLRGYHLMSAEAKRKKEYALGNFNTCDHAGSHLRIEVNRIEGTQDLLGFCSHERKWIDVNPTCRICLRHTLRKKRSYKKTPTQRQRISQGRKRQRERKLEGARNQAYKPFIPKNESKNGSTKHDI